MFSLFQWASPAIAAAPGIASYASPGTSKEQTDDTESIVAPSRIGDYAYADLTGLVAGSNGVAVGAAAKVGYVGQGPHRLQLQASPFMMAFLDGKSQATALFVAEPMLDTALFGIGPAIGYATGGGFSAPTFGATVRLGTTDGLHLDIRASAMVKSVGQAIAVGTTPPPARHELVFGEFDLHAAIPFSRRAALVLDASALRAALWRASLGINGRLTKTRGSGATFLTISLGFALLDADFALPPGSDTQDFMGGPIFGVGLARRL